MRRPPIYSAASGTGSLLALPHPVDLDALVPGDGPWEVELGYGKGRYLLQQALARPSDRFLGVEVVSKYFRLLDGRARRQGADNLLNLRGEALFLADTVLPRGFATRVHVYFPDPWPKAKHQRRRLFDPSTVDLVLGLLQPGGTLVFATDFLEYGAVVQDLLAGHPDLVVEPRLDEWPDGARTNYEAKYIEEGRPIVRLEAHLRDGAQAPYLHPGGHGDVTSAWRSETEAA